MKKEHSIVMIPTKDSIKEGSLLSRVAKAGKQLVKKIIGMFVEKNFR